MREIMLDCETLALSTRALVWQIGFAEIYESDAAGFACRSALISPTDAFFQQRYFVTQRSTIDWWVEQEYDLFNEWYAAFSNEHGRPLNSIDYVSIADWFRTHASNDSETIWWAKNAAFDFPIFEHIFEVTGTKAPWTHRNKRCLYTLRGEVERFGKLHNKPVEKYVRPNTVTSHDAMFDAIAQAEEVRHYRSELQRITRG